MAIAFGQMAILLSQGAALRNPIKSEQRQQKMRMPNTNCKWQKQEEGQQEWLHL